MNEKQAALSEGVKFVEATYRKPYMAHAAIGPSCAVAQLSDGKMTVWTHSQGVFPLRGNLAMALKMPAENIRCIHAEGSGCYGHNAADDVALDAALLARAAAGRPVRVQWMRADEFLWEPFGPAMVMKVRAALSPAGRIADWNYELWSNTHSTRPSEPGGDNLLASWYLAEPQRPAPPRMMPLPAGGGDRNAVPLYDFPRQRIVNHFIRDMPLRVSALRTLGAYANVFATESFMDELALLADADPVAFRLAHLKDARARAVIEAVAKKAGWKPGERGDGSKGRGIGFAKYKTLATYVAVIAEVEIDRASGRIAVPRVYAAADAGQIINPDGLANQIEGGIVQSTSWTLKEEVKFDLTEITSRDWATYPILTMAEFPSVEIELIDRPEERSLGAGEAAQGPVAAAIANAFAAATGKRLARAAADAGAGEGGAGGIGRVISTAAPRLAAQEFLVGRNRFIAPLSIHREPRWILKGSRRNKAIAPYGLTASPRVNFAGEAGLKPEHRFDPFQHQIAVEEFEHGLFLRDRITAGDDGGDDHIATVVEGDRQHRFRRRGAHLIAAAAAVHPAHRNGPAGAECRFCRCRRGRGLRRDRVPRRRPHRFDNCRSRFSAADRD